MEKRHFVVKLKTGELLAFGDGCNNVEHSESDYIFKYFEEDKKTYTCLGVIPRENILSVISIANKKLKNATKIIRKEKNIMNYLEDRSYGNMAREGVGIIQIKP